MFYIYSEVHIYKEDYKCKKDFLLNAFSSNIARVVYAKEINGNLVLVAVKFVTPDA